jgi:ribosomal protein S18 acetylase RimI-like enzyme
VDDAGPAGVGPFAKRSPRVHAVPAVPVVVRVAEDGDLAVLDRVLPTGRNDAHAQLLARQAAGDASYLVAWQGSEPVGAGLIRWTGRGQVPDPEISNLHVPAPLRSQGIGTAIVRFAEDLVRSRGHARVVIGVDEDNLRAAALYERLGYLDTGLRRTGAYTWHDEAGVGHEQTERVRVLTLEI